MSNAIAQSATQLTVHSNSEENWNFKSSVIRQAERTAKGTTRERQLLNRNKLVSAACAEYRCHFAAIYGKTDRLPTAIFSKIETCVDEFLSEQFKRINPLNAQSLRRGFYHNSRQMEITERIHLVGENKLTLEEQKLGVNMFITAAEKRLKDLEKKPTPDYDREKAVKQQLMQLELTRNFILGEIKHQEELKEAAKAVNVK